jgi:ankyrin repeat protein
MMKKGGTCPLCNAPLLSTKLDVNFQHQVNSLPVFCSKRNKGCNWKGKLEELDLHALLCSKGSVAGMVMSEVSKDLPQERVNSMELMLPVHSGDIEKVRLLLSKGADPNILLSLFKTTPLMDASREGNVEMICLLLDNGADPNLTNSEGRTPLMAAAKYGHTVSVDILLQRGANPDLQNQSGRTALMEAVREHHFEVALKILRVTKMPYIQDKYGQNALQMAISKRQDGVAKALLVDCAVYSHQLDMRDNDGETALIIACKNRNFEIVRRLLSMQANPNVGNKYGETPAEIANRLCEKDILQILLENGANMVSTPPGVDMETTVRYVQDY